MAVELYKHNKIAYDKVKKMFESQDRVAVVHPTGLQFSQETEK